MNIFGSPSTPIPANPTSNIKNLSQRSFNIFFKIHILFPRMKRSNNGLLFSPSLKMLNHPIHNLHIFIISHFQIILDLIRIKSLPHQTVSDTINIIISLSCYFIGYMLYINLIPIFLLVYVGES